MVDFVSGVTAEPIGRLAIRIRGQVQGVGFRPFVYRLAHDLRLGGWVRNDAAGVAIEAQGPATALERFLTALRQPPPLARIDELRTTVLPARVEQEGFLIHASHAGSALAEITPDTAVCAACLAELFDPADRRYRCRRGPCRTPRRCRTGCVQRPVPRPREERSASR